MNMKETQYCASYKNKRINDHMLKRIFGAADFEVNMAPRRAPG